jgi:CRP-like cAMP-binding protein
MEGFMDFREDLKEEELLVLEGYGRSLCSAPGERLSFDPNHEALFVMSGVLQAKAIDATGKTVVRRYTTGDVLNELSVVAAHISLSSVSALMPSVSLVVSQASVDSLIIEHPKVAAKLFRHFAKLIIYRTVSPHSNGPSSHVERRAHEPLSQAS